MQNYLKQLKSLANAWTQSRRYSGVLTRTLAATLVLLLSQIIPAHSAVIAKPSTEPLTVSLTSQDSRSVEISSAVVLAPDVIAAWNKVAWCETHGNWQHQGWLYEGGLGILHSNWASYGGYKYAPHAWLATPVEQIAVALKIQHGLPTPDQHGCANW